MFSKPAAYRWAGRERRRPRRAAKCDRCRSSSSTPTTNGTARIRSGGDLEVEEPRHDVRALDHDARALDRRPLDQGVDADGRPRPSARGTRASSASAAVRAARGAPRRPGTSDVCSVGISSGENIDRMTSRIASVATTRTMPSRAASCVAIVDLPDPRRAADQDHERHVELLDLAPAQEVLRVALPRHLVEHLERELGELVGRDRCAPRSPQPVLDRLGDLVGPDGDRPVTMTWEAISPLEYGSPARDRRSRCAGSSVR